MKIMYNLQGFHSYPLGTWAPERAFPFSEVAWLGQVVGTAVRKGQTAGAGGGREENFYTLVCHLVLSALYTNSNKLRFQVQKSTIEK